MFRFLCVFLLFSFRAPVHGDAADQHMICKTMENVFSEQGVPTSSDLRERLQGPPGKKGVKGDRGFPGSKGQKGVPGDVDYRVVETKMDRKINAVRREFDSRIASLERVITEEDSRLVTPTKSTTVTPVPEDSPCDDGFTYRRKCYFSVLHTDVDVSLREGRKMCVNRKGLLANIYNREHQDMALEHFRAKIPSGRSALYVMLGMTYSPSTRTIRLTNGGSIEGNELNSLLWRGDGPLTDRENTAMKLDVKPSRSSDQGLYNWDPSIASDGVLCEK